MSKQNRKARARAYARARSEEVSQCWEGQIKGLVGRIPPTLDRQYEDKFLVTSCHLPNGRIQRLMCSEGVFWLTPPSRG